MMHNNLFLNRLVIFTDSGQKAYDEKFKKGINIIRGDNSSGKSTIAHFIFYALGGSFNSWTREARKCSFVYAEVEMNGAILTLKREISDSRIMPMFIYWGNYVDAIKVSIEGQWHKFPYNVSDKKSFSNVLFEQLDIPIVIGDSNITMHQLLRLMYVDQDSPTNSLFFYEQFDSPLTRLTISELLLGVYDDTLYDDRITKKELEKRLVTIRGEIDGIRNVYEDKRLLNTVHINTLLANVEAEKLEIESQIIDLKNNTKRVNYTAKTKLNFEELNKEALAQRNLVKKIESDINNLNLEITDSNYFIDSLNHKRKSLKNSVTTREYLGSYPLDYCPECLSKLEPVEEGSCRLCKHNIDDSFGVSQARRMEQEITFQIRESEKLMKIRNKNLESLTNTYNSEKIKLNEVQSKVNFALSDVTSIRDERIDSLLIRKGELEGESNQFRTFLEAAEKFSTLTTEKENAESQIKFLADSITYKENLQQNRKDEVRTFVESFALSFLKKDFEREQDFKNARKLDINYYDNAIYVDGDVRNFSASSNFYLKVASRFSIFFSSLAVESMRYPRFILCDNMEDKGIEKERSQHFQDLIVETAKKYPTEKYQIIFMTSMISDELKESDYLIGEHYTVLSKTLKHV
ncbi:AAA family ATPase [Flavobacterium sp.]|uniref:AAA family ATPase n=1 Tax=Flavobacterium sp. TaxID=239 RepID=UPI00260BB0ED|nr:AAA family ATPase [Flavobacterium sp.]MDD3005611.1 AAA family ATPase [Flavobacterium sp.]